MNVTSVPAPHTKQKQNPKLEHENEVHLGRSNNGNKNNNKKAGSGKLGFTEVSDKPQLNKNPKRKNISGEGEEDLKK